VYISDFATGEMRMKKKLTDTPSALPKVPQFHLICCCGKGGTGEVWEGRDCRGRRCAVRLVPRKCCCCQKAAEPEVSRRCSCCKKEAKQEFRNILSYRNNAGTHENLAEIVRVGRTKNYYYYVLLLADNLSKDPDCYIPDTLAERLKEKMIPLSRVPFLIIQIVQALAHLHSRGIAHLDLKPENIYFHNGILKIADFGLAGECEKIYQEYNGTPDYMPLCACKGKMRDIYAVGKVLYCLYSGNPVTDFPVLAPETDMENVRIFNEIALKCCSTSSRHAYKSVEELKADLAAKFPGEFPFS
jgi:serine/threonine protein kinase